MVGGSGMYSYFVGLKMKNICKPHPDIAKLPCTKRTVDEKKMDQLIGGFV